MTELRDDPTVARIADATIEIGPATEVDGEQVYRQRTPELFAEGQNQPDWARVDRGIDRPEHEVDGYFHRRSWME